jgi:hypothetical protein
MLFTLIEIAILKIAKLYFLQLQDLPCTTMPSRSNTRQYWVKMSKTPFLVLFITFLLKLSTSSI